MTSSLRSVATAFVRQGNAALLIGWLALALSIRIALGGWSWADLVLAGVLLALQPFGEWTVHRFAMHGRARSLGGRSVSTPLRDEHLAHHRSPADLHFMPAPVVLAVALGVSAAVWVVAPTPQLAATAIVVLSFELLAYVWTHVLLHSEHPGGRWLASRRRDHAYHHDVDHHRCFGVVTPIADAILGTAQR